MTVNHPSEQIIETLTWVIYPDTYWLISSGCFLIIRIKNSYVILSGANFLIHIDCKLNFWSDYRNSYMDYISRYLLIKFIILCFDDNNTSPLPTQLIAWYFWFSQIIWSHSDTGPSSGRPGEFCQLTPWLSGIINTTIRLINMVDILFILNHYMPWT